MNTSLLGVLAATILAAGLWMAGRRPRPLLKSTDTSAVAALNRARNTLVWEARQHPPEDAAAAGSPAGEGGELVAPRALATVGATARQRGDWLRELRQAYQAGGCRRLEAMRLARAWGHREALPLLRLGLRDPDLRVMREAALAMEAFRGKPSPAPANGGTNDQAGAPPRNVARTR
ncbi:MAG: hypothetical protein ACK41W_05390 [Cyanobacteriota bacterium]|jgi:hypothetical protein